MVGAVGAGEMGLDLREYARRIWRHRLLIVVVMVVAVGGAAALSLARPRVYRATAQLIIRRDDTLDPGTQDAQDEARNVDTETAVLESQVVRDAAQKVLGHRPSVVISSTETSDVVSVSATSDTARQAADDATVYAESYVNLRREQNTDDLLQAVQQVSGKIEQIKGILPRLRPGSAEYASSQDQLSSLRQQRNELQVSASLKAVAGARMLAAADVPSAPVAPRPVRNIVIAIVLGLLLAIGLAVLREYLDDSVSTREDLERATDGLHVLGEIQHVARWRDRAEAQLVTADAPNSAVAENYRTLRTAIDFVAFDRDLKSILVTSAQPDDGKTTTLANLALATARAGVPVTIVCCDLRRPRIHEFFGLSNEVGFTSVLLGWSTLDDAIQHVYGEPNLTLLAAGPPPPNPSELLSSGRAAETIVSIEKSMTSGLVLVDSPPVLAVGDSLAVSGLVDATLLVAGARSSSRRGLRRTVQMLRQVNAQLIGSVLNDVHLAKRDPASNAYGYLVATPNGSNGSNGSNGAHSRRAQRKEQRAAEKASGQ